MTGIMPPANRATTAGTSEYARRGEDRRVYVRRVARSAATVTAADAGTAGSRVGRRAAWAAALLGGGHAATTLLWLSGSTFLLDTVGGELEAMGRERSAIAVLGLAVVFAAKLVVAASALLYAGVGEGVAPESWFHHARRRGVRAVGWLAAGTLIVYAGVLTVVGLLVQADVITAAGDADHRALAWHAFVWDPWFLAWGAALAVALARSQVRPLGT